MLSASAHAAGSLVGSSAAITANQTVNLTALGTSDWAHWGYKGSNSPGQFDHKASVGSSTETISDYSVLGSGKLLAFPYNLVRSKWTDGVVSKSASTPSEVYVGNNGSGFQVTVPAGTTARVFTIYVGGFENAAKMTAHLSDGSAPDFVDSSYAYNKPGNSNGTNYQAVYTFRYQAASEGQTLTVSWVQTRAAISGGNVNLQAATLAYASSSPDQPTAPSSLTATPQWAKSCPVCGGMAMAHIVLAWDAVPGAASYSVYRGTAKVISGLTAPSWTDMTVVSGASYTYTVTATNANGESQPSDPATAVAPFSPSGASSAVVTAPVNLSVAGLWQNDSTDKLTWSPVPGATGYNIYQYNTLLASHVTTTSYTVPIDQWFVGLTYTVTAVDSMGMETLPSSPVTAQGRYDPTQTPPWTPSAPTVPTLLQTTSEWNGGVPRIHLVWHGDFYDFTYNVYRDGVKVASGLWGLSYYDANVQPGETHSYAVSSLNLPWTQLIESAKSRSVSATAPTSPPVPAAAPVQITGVQANDDSAVISFAAVPGAADYRVYDTAKPNSVKYSGGGLSIEMNGLDPVNGANLVVEAVDKLGPFQTMDGMAGPGAMQMDGVHSAINGQGDPSNLPNVLASAMPVHVTPNSRVLTGSQVFFDNFRNEKPLTSLPVPAQLKAPANAIHGNDEYGAPGNYASYANDKWEIRNYEGDLQNTKIFFMGNHFMDTLYDGGTARVSNVMHNNNASLVMLPKATADISGGKILHVTFEVDAHFDGRRWCDLIVAPAADTLLNPGKLDGGLWATTSGNMFRWQIKDTFHLPQLFLNNVETDLFNIPNGYLEDVPTLQRMIFYNGQPLTNGTGQDLDKRHRFDLYLSQTHMRLMENGELVKDSDLPKSLPFAQCQIYFVHELYHTGNDRPEQIVGPWGQDAVPNPYWFNYRPWADERHWDNMGQEVLDAFPS